MEEKITVIGRTEKRSDMGREIEFLQGINVVMDLKGQIRCDSSFSREFGERIWKEDKKSV